MSWLKIKYFGFSKLQYSHDSTILLTNTVKLHSYVIEYLRHFKELYVHHYIPPLSDFLQFEYFLSL